VHTYIALLRGINLGPNRRMAMADLRGWLTGLGYGNVRTLLQSGNAVFDADGSAAQVTRALEKGIADGAGFPVDCVVRTAEQLRAVVAAHPFADIATDPSRMGVAFLAAPLGKDRLSDVDTDALAPERFEIGRGRTEIYLWYANGMARAKLTGLVLPDRKLGTSATVRNWNTVTKLVELASS
jgi:uncharacterized protein (DUF1697 family)